MGELTAAVAFCVATSWWMSRWFSCSSARRLSLSTGPPITALSCLFCGPPCNKWILNLHRATSHTGKRLQSEIWAWWSPEVLQGNINKPSSSVVSADGGGGREQLLHLFARELCEFQRPNSVGSYCIHFYTCDQTHGALTRAGDTRSMLTSELIYQNDTNLRWGTETCFSTKAFIFFSPNMLNWNPDKNKNLAKWIIKDGTIWSSVCDTFRRISFCTKNVLRFDIEL